MRLEVAIGNADLPEGGLDVNQELELIVRLKRVIEDALERHVEEIGNLKALPDDLRREPVTRSVVEVDKPDDDCRLVVARELDIPYADVLVRARRRIDDHVDVHVALHGLVEHEREGRVGGERR